MTDDQAAGVCSVSVVNVDPNICSLTSNEKVLIDSDLTLRLPLHETHLLVKNNLNVLLWISHNWSHRGDKDPLSGSYHTFAI